MGAAQPERIPCAAARSRKPAQRGSVVTSATTTGSRRRRRRRTTRPCGPISRPSTATRYDRAGSGGPVAEMDAISVEQQHRAPDAGKLRLDQARQMVENVRERRVGGDHLQDPRLPVAQALGELARRDVAGNAEQAHDLANLVAQRDLGGRDPDLLAARGDDILFEIDHPFARRDDPPLVGHVFFRRLRRVSSRSVLPIRSWTTTTRSGGRWRRWRSTKAALGVLEPEIVGHEVDQLLQGQTLGHERAALPDGRHVAVGRTHPPLGTRAAWISTMRPLGRDEVHVLACPSAPPGWAESCGRPVGGQSPSPNPRPIRSPMPAPGRASSGARP